MFFPTLGLHRLKTTFSPEIVGSETASVIDIGLSSDGTILVLGNTETTVPLTFSGQSSLILGNTEVDVAISLQP